MAAGEMTADRFGAFLETASWATWSEPTTRTIMRGMDAYIPSNGFPEPSPDSLIRRLGSLIRRKYSLLRGVGNLAKRLRHCRWL